LFSWGPVCCSAPPRVVIPNVVVVVAAAHLDLDWVKNVGWVVGFIFGDFLYHLQWYSIEVGFDRRIAIAIRFGQNQQHGQHYCRKDIHRYNVRTIENGVTWQLTNFMWYTFCFCFLETDVEKILVGIGCNVKIYTCFIE
jgi:hypothetical protein